MADPELVKILKRGSEEWNHWQEQQLTGESIDLSEADLGGVNLSRANLSRTNLSRANLSRTNLSRANLGDANLRNAYLDKANLHKARLPVAYLRGANLREADLSEANLYGVNLQGAILRKADLSGANLSNAMLYETSMAQINLSTTKGLATIHHRGPSAIELFSVQLPQDGSALLFLRGAGVPDEWIDLYRAQMIHPIRYNSCFICYAHQDDGLAHRLHSDLQDHGVRCWFAPHDMKIGDKIRPRIDEAIHLQDKLLLILSEHSVASDWVEHEVETALARERKERRTILFPIRLDNAILEQEYTGWPALVQNERHIGDFTGWKDHDQYQTAFEWLLHDLKKADE